MTIPIKDNKILWAKAAGRCSMPTCREKLCCDSETPSENTLIGDNCHIVGESTDGPRGKSELSLEDRNRYPNLILLCRNHHKIVDDDPQTYSIEILHQIKSDHELWIEYQLTQNNESVGKKIYSNIVNFITNEFNLNNWDNLSDCFVRMLIPKYIIDSFYNYNTLIYRTSWPNEITELENAFFELSKKIIDYLKIIDDNFIINERNYYVEDKSWKRIWHDQETYTKYLNNSKKLHQNNFDAFWNIVVSINKLANLIRKDLNPNFFLLEGDFVINDFMGVTHDGLTHMIYFPKDYRSI